MPQRYPYLKDYLHQDPVIPHFLLTGNHYFNFPDLDCPAMVIHSARRLLLLMDLPSLLEHSPLVEDQHYFL